MTMVNLAHRFPLAIKGISAGGLFGLGDIITQKYILHDAKFDWKRFGQFFSYAAIWYAPTQHFWFVLMERYVATGAQFTRQPMLQAFSRVTVHSLVYAPFSIISLFAWMSILNGRSISGMLSPEFIFPVWLGGASFWIPTMMAVYRFVPINRRVFVTSAANVAWSCYLSFTAYKPLRVDDVL